MGELSINPYKVSEMMNNICPVTAGSILNGRITFVTPGVNHFTSRYDSIKGTRKHYCYLLLPGKNGVYYRRYVCLSCHQCKNLNFLKCINSNCGTWKYQKFTLNQSTLKSLFKPYFGPGV